MVMWKRRAITAVAIVMILPMVGCSMIRENPRAAKGTALGTLAGAAAGAGLGALAGGGKGAAIGAGIGAGVGALSGGLIGSYMDKQARELEQIMAMQGDTNDRLRRVENGLQMSLGSDTMFDHDSATLHPGAQTKLQRFAQSFNNYDRTNLLVVGHTDSTGSAEYNDKLSERRAATVRNVLVDAGVNPRRIATRGDGEHNPVATNSTAEGRARNRRVEVVITPDEGLRYEHNQAGGVSLAPDGRY